MTTPTAQAAAIPSDDDVSLSARLSAPTGACDGTNPPDPAAGGTPAQSAARRLGGQGGPLWRPASGGSSLILKAGAGMMTLVLAGCVLFLWLTVRQQQVQLTTLDAAFRSGQLQSLPDRMLETENKLQQFMHRYQADAEKWQQVIAQQQSELSALKAQVTTLAADLTATQSATAQGGTARDEMSRTLAALQKALDVQTQRTDTLMAWKAGAGQRAAAVRRTTQVPGGGRSDVKKPTERPHLKSPFTLVSTEHRGGQAYAVVLPQGAGGWAQLHMLSPGESLSGWTLVSVDGRQATFRVGSRVQHLTL
ncbi:hypothetical protein DS487_16980 [Salmonella enterica subsp. enterica]|nr:hypothetical protein [Salmonella enterica subsp. enterica serovar Hvittingfoss]